MLPMRDLLNADKLHTECALRKPIEIGRFSLDGSRKFHHDRHQMTCFSPPLINGHLSNALDLNDGYGTERFIKRDEDVKERLDHLLEWMVLNKFRFTCDSKLPVKRRKLSDDKIHMIGDAPDFVLWRGHITKFVCTPFENRDGWIMACQKLGSTIYISEVESEEATDKRRNRTSREDLMTYWGVRFEGYMTGPFPKPGSRVHPKKGEEQTIVNTNKAFCSVFRSRLSGRHTLVYGGEVDCCQPVQTLTPPDCYIELKTSRQFTSRRQEENFFRYKALKWWAQSYLAGIPQITCGFRDDNGFVCSVKDFSTFDLPEKAMPLRNSWNPNTCLMFLDNLLQTIKDLCASNKVTVTDTLTLSWKPDDAAISYTISNSPQDRFLPSWYVREFVSV